MPARINFPHQGEMTAIDVKPIVTQRATRVKIFSRSGIPLPSR
jgi:hypothetical protein